MYLLHYHKIEINTKTEKNHIRIWNFYEFIKKIKKILKHEKQENATFQNLGEAVKATLRRKFLTLTVYIRENIRLKISTINIHFKKLEEEQRKPKE